MVDMKLQIAEHTIKVITYAPGLASFFEENYLQAKEDSSPDITIVIHDGYGKAFDSYDVTVETHDEVILYSRSDYRIDVDEDFTRASIQVHDTFALKHAMMNLYSSFAVQRGWGLLIHSSCIVERKSAYLFAGPSGAGKSTVALLSRPRQILSDEATIVKIGENEAIIFDSPFRSDYGSPSHREGVPLKAIQLLKQAPVNRRNLIAQMDGLIGIMDKVFFWTPDVNSTRRVMRLCQHLTSVVPVYELQFQKNDSFWREIS